MIDCYAAAAVCAYDMMLPPPYAAAADTLMLPMRLRHAFDAATTPR